MIIENPKILKNKMARDGSFIGLAIGNNEDATAFKFTYQEFQEFCREVSLISSAMTSSQKSGYQLHMSSEVLEVAAAPEQTTNSVFLSLRQQETQMLHNFSLPAPVAHALCEKVLIAIEQIDKGDQPSKH